MDQQLLNFILEARRLGATNDQIIDLLVNKGYSNDQILAGIIEADKQLPANDIASAEYANVPVAPPEPVVTEPIVDPSIQGDISAFAVPSPEPVQPMYRPEPNPKEATPRYVNESAMRPTIKVSKKSIVVGLTLIVMVAGGGISYRMGLMNSVVALFRRSSVSTEAFAQYEQIPKETAILLNDSVRFTITGTQMMSNEEFNDLQEGTGAKIGEDNQALLVYYTLQNTSDAVQVITTSEGDLRTFSIVDKNKKRVDVDSIVLSESLNTLADLKPKQYTSNALIFEIPKKYENSTGLYFLLQSDEASPQKGYLPL